MLFRSVETKTLEQLVDSGVIDLPIPEDEKRFWFKYLFTYNPRKMFDMVMKEDCYMVYCANLSEHTRRWIKHKVSRKEYKEWCSLGHRYALGFRWQDN